MRLIRIVAALALAVPLSGCLFWQANYVSAVALTSLAKPARARIVYGLDASAGGLAVSMSHYDPGTGKAGNCDRDDRTEASIAESPSGTTYFAFDAPAGEYVVTRFSTGPLDRSTTTGHFFAPAGRSVYVGTFFNNGPPDYNQQRRFAIRRDFDVASRALGAAAAGLTLAEELGPVTTNGIYMCLP